MLVHNDDDDYGDDHYHHHHHDDYDDDHDDDDHDDGGDDTLNGFRNINNLTTQISNNHYFITQINYCRYFSLLSLFLQKLNIVVKPI